MKETENGIRINRIKKKVRQNKNNSATSDYLGCFFIFSATQVYLLSADFSFFCKSGNIMVFS